MFITFTCKWFTRINFPLSQVCWYASPPSAPFRPLVSSKTFIRCVRSISLCSLLILSHLPFDNQRDFLKELSPSQISWIGSMQLFLMFSLGPISGKLFDEGYFKPLLLSSSLLYLFWCASRSSQETDSAPDISF